MEIQTKGYKVEYMNNVLTISGKLSMMVEDYSEIEAFFEKVMASRPSKIVLDIRNLEYMNSSGIKTICVNLILEAADIKNHHMQILCSNKYAWQRETIPAFKALMDNMEILFE